MSDNKKAIFLAVIAVSLLILIGISATYAYFANQMSNNADIDVITETASATEVEYSTNSAIVLENAEPGDKAETTFSIALTASNKTDDTVTYGIDWIINTNTFEYEPENATDAQLIYSIYYSEDNTTWTPLKENQDCTKVTGTLNLASNQVLSATVNNTETIYWKVVIEYKSYDYNQATNMTKKLAGYIDVTGLE